MTCPDCEYHKQRAQLWRNEAYKHSGHPLGWEPELMVRPKPLTEEEIRSLIDSVDGLGIGRNVMHKLARAIERVHGIGEKE